MSQLTPITRITKTEAMKLLGLKKKAFTSAAELLGFTQYPAITRGRKKEGQVIGVVYSKEDVIKKWNKTLPQLQREALNQ